MAPKKTRVPLGLGTVQLGSGSGDEGVRMALGGLEVASEVGGTENRQIEGGGELGDEEAQFIQIIPDHKGLTVRTRRPLVVVVHLA